MGEWGRRARARDGGIGRVEREQGMAGVGGENESEGWREWKGRTRAREGGVVARDVGGGDRE